MPQLNRPISRTNATQACTNCQTRHQRATEPFISQVQTLDDQNIALIDPHESSFRTTEAFINHEPTLITTSINPYEEFQSSYSNFGTPHIYNSITTLPSLGITEAFIDQELTPNYQNNTLINTYEITTKEFQSPYSTIETPRISNHITTIPSFGTIEPFIVQGQTLNDQSTTSINPYEYFKTIEAFVNNEPTPTITSISPYEEFQSSYSNFGTRHIYNSINTIPSFGITEAFIDQGPTFDDQNTTLINTYDPPFRAIGAFIDQKQNNQNTTPTNPYENYY
ncbi:15009_t:CDS:2 [Dentiscutata erythropus]|uniref:15009_t:CDS:1 n=1 Tax=Dentiscutata erythropus TaxID=1348616 RepID=A0A9N9HJS3_9GLOM|nr:15009_t:CDS:2 [Dentiscutata erythropus]